MSTDWTLKGIRRDSGSCDHCGRTLGRLFRVADAAGVEMTVGVGCSKKLTGYSWSVAQAERMQACADREARAAERWPELWSALLAQMEREQAAFDGYTGDAGAGLYELRDRGNVQYAAESLALSIAKVGSPEHVNV